jgi:hypothetical protein
LLNWADNGQHGGTRFTLYHARPNAILYPATTQRICTPGFTSYQGETNTIYYHHTHISLSTFNHGPSQRQPGHNWFLLPFMAGQTHCLLTTGRHTAGAIQQQKRELELLFLEHQQRIYIINGEELEAVDHFKYLGCPISTTGLDWPAVQYSIKKAHQQWARISKILTWQGSRPKVMGYYYKMVCQAMLLYSCETWVITQAIYNKLESFHHHVARQISRKRQEYLLPWARERPLLQQSKQLGRGFGDMSPLLEVLCDQ